MSPYETHVQFGVTMHLCVLAGTVVAVFFGVPLTVVGGAVVGTPVIVAGAVFPDCDHHQSRPYRVGFRWLPRLIACYTGLVLYMSLDTLLSGTPLIGAPEFWTGVLTAGLVTYSYYLTKRGIPILRPSHRGITHHPLTGVLFGVAITTGTFTWLWTAGLSRPRVPGSVVGL